jgi:hypothetical protein
VDDGGPTQQRLGCVLGEHYPLPIVEPASAAREARERIWARRQELGFAELADAIQRRHGSRRSGLAPSGGQASAPIGMPAAPAISNCSWIWIGLMIWIWIWSDQPRKGSRKLRGLAMVAEKPRMPRSR